MSHSTNLGTHTINRLLVSQSVPAAIGFLVMSVYMVADTIFVGQWVGSLAIAAIAVVMPFTFFISSIGMAIGIGGASIISRALGAEDNDHAAHTFGNQITLTIYIAALALIPGYIFEDEVLRLFGGKGEILEEARVYYRIILAGVPFLAWAMMSNNVIRAQGYPRDAMMVMLIPAVINLVLDPIFIKVFDWGLAGAAWATTLSYLFSAGYGLYFFAFGKSEIRMKSAYLRLKARIVGEMASLGLVSLARQGALTTLSIVLNNALFSYGGEIYLAVFGVINRIMMFTLSPMMGITQGMLAIVGYNYGAQKYDRVRLAMRNGIIYGTIISSMIFLIIWFFRIPMVKIFGDDPLLHELTPPALIMVFLGTPIIAIQMLGSAYFQAIGKAWPALFLSLTRQALFLIPLAVILPALLGIEGIWVAFPVSDLVSTLVSIIFIIIALRKLGQASHEQPL